MAPLLRSLVPVETELNSALTFSLLEPIVISQRRYVHPQGNVREIEGASIARRSHERQQDRSERTWGEHVRRVVDVSVAAVALLVLSPLMLVVAALIKIDSPGPVLFRQQRIGRNRRRSSSTARPGNQERRKVDPHGRPFVFYKFRTMYADARTRFPHLYEYSHCKDELRSLPIKMLMAKRAEARLDRGVRSWPKEALQENDPRVTRMGRWLRRTSLDELPNLLNVLKGDIHLVGPRPDIADNIRFYEPHELRILDVKPGVTGLAQVEGRGLLSFEETNKLDLEYLDCRSLWMDARILGRTFVELIKGRGAY
jgi:lipopolysaccharide/colanic/teichoic acid biosynthesis glycosyltransferase